jgi:hypothetical protein
MALQLYHQQTVCKQGGGGVKEMTSVRISPICKNEPNGKWHLGRPLKTMEKFGFRNTSNKPTGLMLGKGIFIKKTTKNNMS